MKLSYQDSKLPAKHQVQFEVHVRPRLIQPFAGVTHHAELLAAIHLRARLHHDRRADAP